MDQPSRNPRIYKQVINNQFSNQQSNLLVNSSPVCPLNVWDNPENRPPHMQTQQTYTLVPTAIAQAVQQLLPLANTLQNTSLPISYNAPQYVQSQPTPKRISRSAKYRKIKWKRDRFGVNTTTQNKFYQTQNKPDLRQKLYRRRSCSESFNQNDKDYFEKSSSRWQNNWNDQRCWESSIQMNLGSLKSLTSSGSHSGHWYIAVDTDVLLKNYNYLNNMVAADSDFQLMIPHHVMLELQTRASEITNVQDRRTLRFLKDQIESGQAVLGEEETGENASIMTMKTCTKQASQNIVILITKSAETLKYKSINSNIHLFTMQDIKDILAKKTSRLPRAISPTLALKITVPNDVAKTNVSHDNCHEVTKENICTEPLTDNICSESTFEEPSAKISQASWSQSSQKSVTKGNLAQTGAGTGNLLVNSQPNSYQSPSRSVQKSSYEVSDSTRSINKSALEVDAAEASKVDCNQSPSNSTGVKFSDRNIPAKNALRLNSVDRSKAVCHQSPTKDNNVRNKVQNPSPTKSTENSSLCSSSTTSGHVSVDTVMMKRIISMKKLGTENSRMLQKHTKSVISNTSQTSTQRNAQTVDRPSLTRSASYDNESETSVSAKTVRENIIIDEVSTSGIISNSESSHSERLRSPVKLRTVVMFGVSCQSIEDVLKTRWDEWVFRLVQIMEEVLRVKLQEKLPTENKEYPAPRDLQEAARCIIKKFSNNFSVVDAANKLSFVLYKMRSENGKLAVNVEPSDYMEMYSYGVFLVETFQDMSVDCKEKYCKREKTKGSKEDLTDTCSCYEVNTASVSLKKLLYDIQNANLETFVDNSRELSSENINADSYYEIDTRDDIQEMDNSFDKLDTLQFETDDIREMDNSFDKLDTLQCETDDIQEMDNSFDKLDTLQCEDRVTNNAYNYNLQSQKRKSQSIESNSLQLQRSPKKPHEENFVDNSRELSSENINADSDYEIDTRDDIQEMDNSFDKLDTLQCETDDIQEMDNSLDKLDTLQCETDDFQEMDNSFDKLDTLQCEDRVTNNAYNYNLQSQKRKSQSIESNSLQLQRSPKKPHEENFVDNSRELSSENINADSDYDIDTRDDIQEMDNSFDKLDTLQCETDDIQEMDNSFDKLDTLQCEDRVTNNAYNYNLQSQKRKSQSIESNSLQLQRSPKKPREENLQKFKIHFSKGDFSATMKSQTKFIRNFTINEDIEKKVETRLKENEYDKCSENDLDHEVDNFEDGMVDPMPTEEQSKIENDNSKSNQKFMSFIGRITRRIGEVFIQAKSLCEEYVKNKSSNLSNGASRDQLFYKVELACHFIGNIHNLLDRISKRELQDQSIQTLLAIAKVDDFIPDDNLCLEYRLVINKCKEYAEQFHNSIQKILKMVD